MNKSKTIIIAIILLYGWQEVSIKNDVIILKAIVLGQAKRSESHYPRL